MQWCGEEAHFGLVRQGPGTQNRVIVLEKENLIGKYCKSFKIFKIQLTGCCFCLSGRGVESTVTLLSTYVSRDHCYLFCNDFNVIGETNPVWKIEDHGKFRIFSTSSWFKFFNLTTFRLSQRHIYQWWEHQRERSLSDQDWRLHWIRNGLVSVYEDR